MRVVDPDFETPITHGWAITYQRQLFTQTLIEVAYVGRRADHLFGAYNVNQAEIFDNGFLTAFNTCKAGGESPLIDQLLATDTRRSAGETGSAMVRRLFSSELTLNSVAGRRFVARHAHPGHADAVRAGRARAVFLLPVPAVPRRDERDRFERLLALSRARTEARTPLRRRIQLSPRLYPVAVEGHTLLRPRVHRGRHGNAQSATSTPFDIFNRDLNYALSDFDRTHVFPAQGVWELPFGQGRRFASGVSRLTDILIGGWTLSGQFVARAAGR